ncbi:coenzyme A transporter [Tilletia horrida]|uniref:Coenzyme A transporter n=1 Tax=Tilletia horrida TaxID=155126 RepID=A0AAN6GTH3_9BASI|nr:coenzyme A transporter [Tilletia horrida]KAK0567348.1 coenzyme A transporter [Tilletia horrida]
MATASTSTSLSTPVIAPARKLAQNQAIVSAASAPQVDSISDELRGKRKIEEKRSWAYVLRSGLAGGVAGCVAKTAIAPLDRVKILFQANNPEFAKYSGRALGVFYAIGDIFRTKGPLALFQGHSATLVRIFPYAAIKYMAYDKFHFLLIPSKEYETSARLFLAGSASGVTSVVITYPLELIRVRLAYETKRDSQLNGIRDIVRKIYTEGSTQAPFSGDARRRTSRATASSSGSATAASTTGSNAASAGGAKSGVNAGNLRSLSSISSSTIVPLSANSISSFSSAASSAFSSSLSHPNSGPGPPSQPIPMQSSTATLTPQQAFSSRMLTRFPILKFYRGFTVTLIGMIPYAGTSFVVFGRCRSLMHQVLPAPSDRARLRWYHSKVFQDLTAGGLAGAISQTAAYPFEVIRRRQQVGAVIRPGSMLGMGETARYIWKTSGFKGFYVGLSIGFLKVVPMTSISFAVWLGMKRWMDK